MILPTGASRRAECGGYRPRRVSRLPNPETVWPAAEPPHSELTWMVWLTVVSSGTDAATGPARTALLVNRELTPACRTTPSTQALKLPPAPAASTCRNTRMRPLRPVPAPTIAPPIVSLAANEDDPSTLRPSCRVWDSIVTVNGTAISYSVPGSASQAGIVQATLIGVAADWLLLTLVVVSVQQAEGGMAERSASSQTEASSTSSPRSAGCPHRPGCG